MQNEVWLVQWLYNRSRNVFNIDSIRAGSSHIYCMFCRVASPKATKRMILFWKSISIRTCDVHGNYLENGEPLFCGSRLAFRDFIQPVTKADRRGRLKKKFEETALLGQKWLKDEDKTVQEVLKDRGLGTVGLCWTIFDIIWLQQSCCSFAVRRNDTEAFRWDWSTHWPSTTEYTTVCNTTQKRKTYKNIIPLPPGPIAYWPSVERTKHRSWNLSREGCCTRYVQPQPTDILFHNFLKRNNWR